MFINFRQHKTIKELRALVIAEEGGEVLVGLDDLVNWGIVSPSRITNKWMRLGVPLVGCGECSDVAHGKLQGNFSILK